MNRGDLPHSYFSCLFRSLPLTYRLPQRMQTNRLCRRAQYPSVTPEIETTITVRRGRRKRDGFEDSSIRAGDPPFTTNTSASPTTKRKRFLDLLRRGNRVGERTLYGNSNRRHFIEFSFTGTNVTFCYFLSIDRGREMERKRTKKSEMMTRSSSLFALENVPIGLFNTSA